MIKIGDLVKSPKIQISSLAAEDLNSTRGDFQNMASEPEGNFMNV